MPKLKVFSMFDGVGGFIIGLNDANKALHEEIYETLYSNQYEPSKKDQVAFDVACYQFPDMKHIGMDVAEISNQTFQEMKNDGVNMIVAGFPCQDYSVARSKKDEKGIEGKKGVLFWEIIRAVKNINPEYLILENVDRLLKAPSNQRGRDFAIMLGAFNQLGYSVEWRVINAAEYGRAQRRRRVFFFVYRNDSVFAQSIHGEVAQQLDLFSEVEDVDFTDYIMKNGLFAKQFPVEKEPNKNRVIVGTLSDVSATDENYILDISNHFQGQFWNSGLMRHGSYLTIDTIPVQEKAKTLGEVVKEAAQFEEPSEDCYLSEEKIEKFKYLRGGKKFERTNADGHKYVYSEGAMSEVDAFDLPARTMLTSEGTVNRSSHFLKDEKGYRTLTAVEAELIQDFPPNWTKYRMVDGKKVEVTKRNRMFFMGNALVTGIVKRIGIELGKRI